MDCRHFISCSANLCPLDSCLSLRSWFIGEDICKLKPHSDHPLVKRQKQLNRRRPKEHLEKPLFADWLTISTPKKRNLTRERREALSQKMKNINKAKIPKST
ncbi:MAG TPA: hypothetical protein PLM79_18635 [Syntrophobacteraceae bacterium]|nr:hypothetical protein [Syntrophobacteraceae bacterium]